MNIVYACHHRDGSSNVSCLYRQHITVAVVLGVMMALVPMQFCGLANAQSGGSAPRSVCPSGPFAGNGGAGPIAIPWEVFAQGEYIGPSRLQHVPEYRLRVDDDLNLIYRLTRQETSQPYQLNVGDQIRIESITDASLNRDLVIQPDGTVTLLLLGQTRAAGHDVATLSTEVNTRYMEFYKVPAVTVTPIRVNTQLEDLRATVDSRAGQGGQSLSVRINPEGTIQLPAVGTVPAQGLTLRELKQEVDLRYALQIQGIEVTPVLVNRAPRFAYVLGEVQTSGRFELTGPTTVIQAIALAGSWNPGGNLRQIVVFRRTAEWGLVATRLNLMRTLNGNDSQPSDEIWLRDSDIVIIPKGPLLRADELIERVFTRGIYGVLPTQGITINLNKLSTI